MACSAICLPECSQALKGCSLLPHVLRFKGVVAPLPQEYLGEPLLFTSKPSPPAPNLSVPTQAGPNQLRLTSSAQRNKPRKALSRQLRDAGIRDPPEAATLGPSKPCAISPECTLPVLRLALPKSSLPEASQEEPAPLSQPVCCDGRPPQPRLQTGSQGRLWG